LAEPKRYVPGARGFRLNNPVSSRIYKQSYIYSLARYQP
jgi:hypothetical protein